MVANVLSFDAGRPRSPILAIYSESAAQRLLLARVCEALTRNLETYDQLSELLPFLSETLSVRLLLVEWTRSTKHTYELLREVRIATESRLTPVSVGVVGSNGVGLRRDNVEFWLPSPLPIGVLRQQVALALGLRELSFKGLRK